MTPRRGWGFLIAGVGLSLLLWYEPFELITFTKAKGWFASGLFILIGLWLLTSSPHLFEEEKQEAERKARNARRRQRYRERKKSTNSE